MATPPSEIPLLCVCSSFRTPESILDLIGRDIFPVAYCAAPGTAAEVFKEPKESGKKIVLVVLGPAGAEAIPFLCDDYDLPQEQRRVVWIHSVSAGIDWYKPAETAKYVGRTPFTNGKGGYSYFLALHVLYSILYFNRQTAHLQANRKARQWEMFASADLRGLKVGLLGYGDIGIATAKMLQPLALEVTGLKRSAPAQPVDEHGATILQSTPSTIDQVIRESDFVVNILPHTPDTEQLFNRDTFAKMKKTAIYINVGRGGTQNEEDLVEALTTGVIAGASLDVFQVEPLPNSSALWDVDDDKVLLTSHNACITTRSFQETVNIFSDNAREYVRTGVIGGYKPDFAAGY